MAILNTKKKTSLYISNAFKVLTYQPFLISIPDLPSPLSLLFPSAYWAQSSKLSMLSMLPSEGPGSCCPLSRMYFPQQPYGTLSPPSGLCSNATLCFPFLPILRKREPFTTTTPHSSYPATLASTALTI